MFPSKIAKGKGILSNAANYISYYLKKLCNKFVNGNMFYILKHPKFMIVLANCF